MSHSKKSTNTVEADCIQQRPTERKPYTAAKIILERDLETRAGSPIEDIADPFNIVDPFDPEQAPNK
jgi:hypothetical protein